MLNFGRVHFQLNFPERLNQVPEAFLSFAQMDSWTRCKLFLRTLAEVEGFKKGYNTRFFLQ